MGCLLWLLFLLLPVSIPNPDHFPDVILGQGGGEQSSDGSVFP
ncbi:hypothetical protein LEP1GSC195_2021 [Leptospira wolbachii serovar Codice str. CDC]|uniref:Uncharacterized protein n=1 Tax=Leptospira wolbachii serovar Codice str. CDC TaxID=1218599 RepID=R9A0X9_9LEPT|nr:hypothetical protein LEP1GSC195_2021 [Leptospira wolbachii serovar Codice str. CDC]